MKQFAKQKWVLSALLITALGSQYYFSSSSNQVHSVDMSSLTTVETVIDAAAILQAATPANPSTPSTPSVPVTTSVPAEAVTSTEGVAPTVPCEGCVLLSRENAEKIRKILADVAAGRVVAPAAEAVAEPVETPLERSRRLREEAAEARRLAAKEKAAKARDEKTMRNEEFKDKMAQAAESCGSDITCVSEHYTSLLSRYSGTRKIDMTTAAAAYARYIQPGLKAAVGADGDDAAAQETLRTISMDIPLEYRAIKEASVKDITAVAQDRALAANQNFRLADKYGKEKRYEESNQAFQEATVAARDFQSDMQMYQGTIREGAADDAATLAYMQRNFMPEIARLYGNLNNLNGLNTTATDPASGIPTGSRTRGETNPAAIDNGKMSVLSQPNGTAQFGTATASPTGNRTRGN